MASSDYAEMPWTNSPILHFGSPAGADYAKSAPDPEPEPDEPPAQPRPILPRPRPRMKVRIRR